MLGKEKRFFWILSSMLLVVSMYFTGCSHLDKGWSQFGKGEYQKAKVEWELEKKADLSEPIAKAVAALAIVDSYNQAIAAKAAGDNQAMVDHSRAIVAQDRWENKDWLKKSPILQKHIDEAQVMIDEGYMAILTQLKNNALAAQKEKNYQKMLRYAVAMAEKETADTKIWFDKSPALRQLVNDGHTLVEAAYFGIINGYANEQNWVEAKKEFEAYAAYTKQYGLSVSKRNNDLNALADVELEKRKKVLAAFDQNLECAKKQFLEEQYNKAMECIKEADALVESNKMVRFNVDDLDYVRQSTEQAIEIQRQIEAEKARMAEEERKRIEEANKRAEEEAARLEAERQQQENAKIRLARAAERQRLIQLAEERKKEAERQRIIEERNRRWRAFLAKGAPLKPLVTTVLQPSEGIGDLPKGQRQQWQGGSQLPKPKDKTIESKDVYALEVEVPRTHALTYLRNYFKEEEEREKNMLKAPKTQGGFRSYYTEDFKGGRYYVEVENEKSDDPKYDIKARIYKIPVTF